MTFNITLMKWASKRENLSLVFAKHEGSDQPVYPRSLISNFGMCHIKTWNKQNLNFLGSLLSRADGFGYDLNGNPEDKIYSR